jgi:hypothetical protein
LSGTWLARLRAGKSDVPRSRAIRQAIARSTIPLNLHLAVLHDLLPARDFLAQEGAEFLRRAADRIDADGRELPGEVRVLERATDFAIRGEADVNRLAGLAGSVENNPKQTFATVYAVFDLAGVR